MSQARLAPRRFVVAWALSAGACVITSSAGGALAQPAPGLTLGAAPGPAGPGPAGPVPGGDFDALIAQAQRAVSEERHSEALRLWHAAYTQRQRPELLLHIARAEHRLGLTDAALDAYRRYLTAEPNPVPALRAEAEQAIAALGRMAAPPAALAPPPPYSSVPAAYPGLPPPVYDEQGRLVPLRLVNERYHRTMRTTGIVLASIGYGVSFIVGLTLGSMLLTSSSRRDQTFGRGAITLLVPVAGPVISGIMVPATYDKEGTFYWSLPWVLTAGAMQIVGVGLWGGAYRHPQKRLVPSYAKDFRLVPAMGPGYAGFASGFNF